MPRARMAKVAPAGDGRHRGSLRRRIAAWMLPPIALMIAINAALSYFSSLEAVNRAYDRSLGASIKSIAESTYSLEGEIVVNIPTSAFDIFGGESQERIFYAVIGPGGAVITGYDDLPLPTRTAAGEAGLAIENGIYNGKAVRIGAMRKRLYDPSLVGDDSATIVFAETTESRIALAHELFADSLRRQALLVALGLLVLMFALSSALRPLVTLRDRVLRRAPEDLTPVPDDKVPAEVTPLIDAINRHTERLSRLFAARRRFLADAAHQIRTPLAVLTTQAEVGMRQRETAANQETFAAMLATIKSTRRMADQMLALSRAENADALQTEHALFDLAELARDATAELAMLAMGRRIELAFEPSGAAPMRGDRPMLRELIANLVHNALQYSPPDTEVVVATGRFGDTVMLSVSDQGPGIPAAERDKVFQRFYRVLGQGGPEGSGLGLAIVRQIAELHGGRVRLGDGQDGRGLHVEIEFPAAGAANER